jgi:prevent-host-death family protein
MTTIRVPIRELRNNTGDVLQHVDDGDRVIITRNNVPVAVLSPVDSDELLMEKLVTSGEAPADWKQRQQRLRAQTHKPRIPLPAGVSSASELLIAMRDEDER